MAFISQLSSAADDSANRYDQGYGDIERNSFTAVNFIGGGDAKRALSAVRILAQMI
jgi:hypothetical protein